MENQTGEGKGTWLPSAASPDGGMRRSLSEWEFRQFLKEFHINRPNEGINAPCGSEKESATNLRDIYQNPHREVTAKSVPSLTPPPPPPMHSDEYQAHLKSRLQFECATVAFIRQSANAESRTSSATSTSVLGSQRVSGVRCDPANTQDEDAGSAIVKARAKGKSSSASETSEGGSSMYEAEGETETTQDMNAANKNQNKRKLLNRESARRSRRRKHEQTAKLETTVAQLADEKANLLKRLSEVLYKSNKEAETNKILRGQAESLRSQVKLMEEVVKKVAGFAAAVGDKPPGQKAVTPIPQVQHRGREKQPYMQISGPEIQRDSANGHQQDTQQKRTNADAADR